MRALYRRAALLSGVLAAIVLAPAVTAPQEEEAATRVIVIQKFQVPRAAWPDFLNFMDEHDLPTAKENPHVLSYRVASHYFGKAAQDMWIITEYRDLAAVEQGLEWDIKHQDDKYPEGSEERKALDDAYEKYFLPYWGSHSDEILILSEDRMK